MDTEITLMKTGSVGPTLSPIRQVDSNSAFIPCKKCGGHASLWMEYMLGDVRLWWYECDCCHEYPDVETSKEKALEMWNGVQLGTMRPKVQKWNTGF